MSYDAQSIFTNESIQDSADVLGFRLPLLVNVNLDDDTLTTCFSIWLAGIRASLYPAPKAFEDRDLKHWKKFGLLPAFDLQLWNRLTGAGYTDAFIAQAICPMPPWRRKSMSIVPNAIGRSQNRSSRPCFRRCRSIDSHRSSS